jgi:uncharacterized protein
MTMEIVKDRFIPMRDGVHLAIDIYRPGVLTRHAAVLITTPYRKDAQFVMPLGSDGRPVVSLQIASLPVGFNPMLMSVAPLVEAGYVVVVADARGTGFSEGSYDYYNFEGGPFDGYDTVEWIAEQPWCDGNVGIMGASAAAISCYSTALTKPPHLKAMAPNMHPADFYHDQWRVGGVFRYENRISWATTMYDCIAPIDPGDPDAPSYERKRAVYEARFHQLYERISSGKNAVNLDWLTEMYRRDTYDDFWKSRSFFRRSEEITIPTLHGGVWYDHFIRGTLASHEAIQVEKRLFVGPGSLTTRLDLGDGGLAELHVAWFDHFLRGIENGVLDGPAARLYLLGEEKYIDEPTWPVPHVLAEMFLGSGPSNSAKSLNDGMLYEDSRLADQPDVLEYHVGRPNRTPRDPADQRSFEEGCLSYSSMPFESDVEVIGTPRLVLYAATDAEDVDICVRLCDVFPDGRSRLLNTGALKGSHAVSHELPTALKPGEVNRFEIEVWAIANVFKAGHRIRIDISASDFPFFEPNRLSSSTEVFHDQEFQSHLVLPIVSR